jgi:hypothetical protein
MSMLLSEQTLNEMPLPTMGTLVSAVRVVGLMVVMIHHATLPRSAQSLLGVKECSEPKNVCRRC